MQANLEAAQGKVAAFQRALNRADDNAKSLLPVARKDAYFVAMTWAWLELGLRCAEAKFTCKDYGLVASQAALWERAGYRDWAACYYDRFQQTMNQRPDKRYSDLAEWVARAKKEIGPPAISCSAATETHPSVPTLEVEAREAQARKNFDHASELLSEAVQEAGPAERNRLLFAKADVLLAKGQAERQLAQAQESKAEEAEERLQSLKASQKTDEESLGKLASKEGPNRSAMADLEARYTGKMNRARQEKAIAEQAAQSHNREAKAAFQDLKHDCTEILSKDRLSATAYYYRALAEDWLDPNDRNTILADIHNSLKIDADNLAALSLVDVLVPEGTPQEKQYLKDNRQFLERCFKFAPYTSAAFLHQAELAQDEKRYVDALRLVETAVEMDPTKLRLYKIRADIQTALGFNDSQVANNLADGYRHAAYISKMRGANSALAELDEWAQLAELAKKKGAGSVECNALFTTCTATAVVDAYGESIYSAIVAVRADGENTSVVQARINRGSEDGVVVGTRGNVWSSKSQDSTGHERKIANLGSSEVLALEPHSALIRIQVSKPAGDGIVRQQDMVQLMARTPKLIARSALWQLAKTDTALIDADDKVILNYDTLYSNETPELDAKLYARMLDEIHREAPLQSNTEILQSGAFAKQSLRQAMQNTKQADVEALIDYLARYPGDTFGKSYYVGRLYAQWISYMGRRPEGSASISILEAPFRHDRFRELQLPLR